MEDKNFNQNQVVGGQISKYDIQTSPSPDPDYKDPNSKEIKDAVKPINYLPDKKLMIGLLSLFLITAISGLYISQFQTKKYRESVKSKQLLIPTPFSNSQDVPNFEVPDNWMTYSNAIYKYTFRYPPQFTVVQDIGPEPRDFGFIIGTGIKVTPEPDKLFNPSDADYSIHVDPPSPTSGVSNFQISQQSDKTFKIIGRKSEISVNGLHAEKITYFDNLVPIQLHTIVTVDFKKNNQNKMSYININTVNTIDSNNDRYTRTFDQILSTFKFIDQDDTSSNQLNTSQLEFSDNIFGINFSYPKGWNVSSGYDGGGESNEKWWRVSIENKGYFSADILESENIDNKSPSEWFNKVKNTHYNQYVQKIADVSLGDNPALITASPNLCKSSPAFFVFIQKPNKILTLTCLEQNNRSDAKDLEILLGNFSQSNTKSTKNIIPPLRFPSVPENIICE